jgi:hypothetical protein
MTRNMSFLRAVLMTGQKRHADVGKTQAAKFWM